MENPTTTSSQQKSPETNHSKQADFDSNPFTISFRGFGLLVDFAKGVFITTLIIAGLGLIGNVIDVLIDTNNQNASTQTAVNEPIIRTDQIGGGEIAIIIAFIASITILIWLVIVAFTAAYEGFVAAGGVSAADRKTISFGDAIQAMLKRYKTLFVAQFIVVGKVVGGTLLFVIPGIRAALRYQAVSYVIMRNPELNSSQAIVKTKQLYKGHLMESFGIGFVGLIIPFIGEAIKIGGLSLSSKQLQNYQEKSKQTPKTHWLNYLGFVLLALFFSFIVAAIALISALAPTL